ncbi:MAG: DUF6128 domain-containing protein [Lachnospiraceae bacterium]
MAEYRRFISYMYLYEGDNKGRNTGFVKAEVRGEYHRLEAMVRRQPLMDGLATVWAFYRKNHFCYGILLGRMTISGGNGNFFWSSLNDTIEGSSCTFEELSGLLIWSERSGNLCVTLWDDLPFSIGMFSPENEKIHIAEVEEEIEDTVMEQEEKDCEENEGIQSAGSIEEIPTDEKSEEMLSEIPAVKFGMEEVLENKTKINSETTEFIESADNVKNAAEFETQIEISPTFDNIAETEQREENSLEAKQGEKLAVQGDNRNNIDSIEEQREKELEQNLEHFFGKENSWDKLCGYYPKMKPFAWNRELDCLKVKPGDLGRLPKENWILGNNSFMLHGYYVHRYLILMKIEQDGKERYLLGVPGIYGNRERFMADMFGFGEFMPVSQRRVLQGQKGFWCVQVTV